jgi:hypothetical protein
MAGFVPAIHDSRRSRKTWMPWTSPGMTIIVQSQFLLYGVIVMVEKSTIQFFGCTKPLILGLSAREPTSCAT